MYIQPFLLAVLFTLIINSIFNLVAHIKLTWFPKLGCLFVPSYLNNMGTSKLECRCLYIKYCLL